MNILTKKEKIQFVLEKVKKHEISAYELGKKTGLNISGVERIINGSVKNPHEKTLDIIIEYIKTLYIKNNNTHILNEETEVYTLKNNQKELIFFLKFPLLFRKLGSDLFYLLDLQKRNLRLLLLQSKGSFLNRAQILP